MKIKLGKKIITNKSPTYFIADIAANHDGNLIRAKKLIKLCAKAGANAAKFQHFKAETIVSDFGFTQLGKKSHQSKWKKSVFETYKSASINFNWTKELKKECDRHSIDFMTAPYDLEYVDKVNKYIKAYKIGSGDINWEQIIKKISKKNKPVILATGASNIDEVKRSVKTIIKINKKIVLMQCNTNYTNSFENYKYINLNVLKSFKKIFGNKVILGLSDHTKGHASVLGAVTLGARVVEKHFTDDTSRYGPDHKFSMDPMSWKKMVEETRNLEKCLGDGIKKVEKNEKQTVYLQRRGVYALNNINKNQKFNTQNLIPLRPHTSQTVSVSNINKILGKRSRRDIKAGEWIKIKDIK